MLCSTVALMAELYSQMYVGAPAAMFFEDRGNGDLWEAREGEMGSVAVHIWHPDGSTDYYHSVPNATLDSVTGVKATEAR